MDGERTKNIVLVLGMYRSCSSEAAEVFASLGMMLSAETMAAPTNAKRLYESEAITGFNDELMEQLGATSFDIDVLPAGWAERLAPEWGDRAATVLEEEYGAADTALMTDPRACHLLPFWLPVFEKKGWAPKFVCILRPPLEDVSSLPKWISYSTDYREMLWLHYALEAERESRGRTRAFVLYSDLHSDWRGTSKRLAATLGLQLTSNKDAEAALDAFVSRSLKHVDSNEYEYRTTLSEAAKIFGVLDRWGTRGENPDDYHRFDSVLAQIKALRSPMLPLAKSELDQFKQAESQHRSKKDMDAKIAESQARVERLRLALKTKTAEAHAQTERVSRVVDELEQTRAERADLGRQLAHARRKPMHSLADLWKYKILRRLGAEASPLPHRMKSRMMRSALKRHPLRSLPEWKAQVTNLGKNAGAVSNSDEQMQSTRHSGQLTPRPDLPNVLIVSHDASWTGAPVLAQNLAREYKDRYNVTILCLRGGTFLRAFEEVAIRVEVRAISGGLSKADTAWLKHFLAEGNFAFAVVNSIESRHVLPVTREMHLPSVLLVHEFASYTFPRRAFPEAIDAADTTVFSTSMTLDNAIDVTGVGYNPKVQVLPQGKCEIPRKAGDEGFDEDEQYRLKELLRPDASGDEHLVMGAGTVQIRKGTDLFIEVARKTLSRPEGRNYRFVWFGSGYAPDEDPEYSVYLQDQLKRAGIEDRVLILPVTPEIEYVYKLADAFLLTSRLDPLPNVAIDAMLVGLPVIGFDKASGIPEILREGALSEDCIVDYLDTSQMSEKLLKVVGRDHARVSAATQAHARKTFNFPAYARQIESWAIKTARVFQERDQAVSMIANDPGFDPAYLRPPGGPGGSRSDDAKYYVERMALGIYPRRPEPGFNQSVYCEHYLADAMPLGDAYADYLQKGRPEGPWKTDVLRGPVAQGAVAATSLRAALHIHAYYIDDLADIILRLKANLSRPTVFVSVSDDDNETKALQYLRKYDGESQVRVVPNLGRDIGPLLTEFGPKLIGEFDVVGHVHTKKSLGLMDGDLVEKWKTFTVENVLGGPVAGAMMDLQLAEFEKVHGLGLTFPADPYVMSWNKNKPHALRLATELGLDGLPNSFDFPVGTMFWMRAEALAPFVKMGLGWTDYPSEPLPNDGTQLHALERLFGIVPKMNGFEVRVTNIKGLTR